MNRGPRWAALAVVLAAGRAAGQPVRESAEVQGPAKTRAAFLTLGGGARSAALADAFVATADDASAGWWNPAGLGRLTEPAALIQHGLLGNGISLACAGGAFRIGPGVMGLNLLAYGFGAYDLRDDTGMNLGSASDWDFATTLSWGMANPHWAGGNGWSGLSLDLVKESIGTVMVAGSLGSIYPIGDRLRVGVALLHLGAGAQGGSLPASARVGAAYETPWAWHPVASLDAIVGLGGQPFGVAVGVEAKPTSFAALRLGYAWHPDDQGLGPLAGLAAGLGCTFRSFGIQYAFRPAGELAPLKSVGAGFGLAMVHRIALTYGVPPAASRSSPEVATLTDTVPARAGSTPATAVQPAVSPGDTAYRAAAAAYAAGKIDTAWVQAYAALKADPAHWQAWQVVGNCQYAKGDVPGALVSFHRSLDLHPDNPALRGFVEAAEKAKPH